MTLEIRKLASNPTQMFSSFELDGLGIIKQITMMEKNESEVERILILSESNVIQVRELSGDSWTVNHLQIIEEGLGLGDELRAEEVFAVNEREIAINCGNVYLLVVNYEDVMSMQNPTLGQLPVVNVV